MNHMRNFMNDIKNMNKFCTDYDMNFGFDIDMKKQYTLLYDVPNSTAMELIFIKTTHVHTYSNDSGLRPTSFVSFLPPSATGNIPKSVL